MHVILTDVDDTLLNYGDAMQDFMESKGFVIKDRMREHHNIPKLYGIDLAHTLSETSRIGCPIWRSTAQCWVVRRRSSRPTTG